MTLPINLFNQASPLALRILRCNSGIPSRIMKDRNTQQPIELTKDQWKSRGGTQNDLVQNYPRTNLYIDLDGMEKLPNNPKALELGGVSHLDGKNPMDYMGCIRQPHPLWTSEECDNIEVTHLEPKGVASRAAWGLVWTLRRVFDLGTLYSMGFRGESNIIRRLVILETVAGIPGMVGGAIRHFRSLRTCNQDHGWIHSLLEEAENERMHLMIAMSLKKVSPPLRFIVFCAQMGITPFYAISYAFSPRFCHSFVGYLEEEAVKTYTKVLQDFDAGKLPKFECAAPEAARKYYHLPEGSSMRDIINNIRADEAHHRELNHCLAHMKKDEVNPFPPGY